MGECLADALLKVSSVLHWLGKYEECNAITLLSRLLRLHELDDLRKLEAYVTYEEESAPEPCVTRTSGETGGVELASAQAPPPLADRHPVVSACYGDGSICPECNRQNCARTCTNE